MLGVPIHLKPVRMKNSLYLLIPKGVSQLLEIDETRECKLTTQLEDQHPILRYEFSTRIERTQETAARLQARRAPYKQAETA